MTPHKQRILHDPKNGLYGDCHSAALASILDLEPDSVPHFMHGLGPKDGAIFNRMQEEFLATLGLIPITVAYDGSQGPEIVLQTIKDCSPRTYFLFSGSAGRGIGHTVVGFDGKIVHDPHPSNCEITEPMDDGMFWVTFIGILLTSVP